MTPEQLPQWVLIFERIGPGSAFMVFTLAVIWKILPAATRLLGAWKRQSDTVVSAIPRAERAFDRLIDKLDDIRKSVAHHDFGKIAKEVEN